MCMVTSGTSRCHARSTTSDARVGNTSDARVARSYHKNFPVSRYLYDFAISGQEKCVCMHVPNWKNVLGVSAVVRCVWHVPHWENVLCCKMCMVTSGTSRCHARSNTSDTRVGNTSDTRVARSYHKNFPVSRYLYDLAISGQEKCPARCCHQMCMVTLGMSRCHA